MSFKSKLPNTGTSIFAVMSTMANQYGAINLSQGFPNFPSSKRLIDLVHDAMNQGHNQYAPMPGVLALRQQIAEKIHQSYGYACNPDTEITITAGATQAIFTIIATVVEAGDEVIVLEPAYDSYIPAIETFGGKAVCIPLQAPDFKPDWERIEKAITSKTKLLIYNTPHNPTGKIVDNNDLLTLQDLVNKTNILVLSDEVYEHLIYDNQLHESALKYERLRQNSFAVYSFGKTFHNTGWKIGYCVAPAALTAEFRKVHQFNVFSVNTPVQTALATFMRDPKEYEILPHFYQQKRDFFQNAMKGSSLIPQDCQGTYFQLYSFKEISNKSDFEFASWLTQEIGVASVPVSAFHSNKQDDKLIRFCFAKTEETLLSAAELLKGV